MNEETLKERVREYTWYNPIDFGNGIIAGGNFRYPAGLSSIHFGLGKWKYIIERNLPDLQGKRVMDIGCNNGLFCVQMARMGAREIIGVDSEETWPKWMEQAEFVKEALEWRCQTRYPIKYIDSDMAAIPELELGRFDLVIALCCVYYLQEDQMHRLFQYMRKNTDYFLVQCNTNRNDQPKDVHRRAMPEFIVKTMKAAGFRNIAVDKPILYERPVVVGSDGPLADQMPKKKIDAVRYWVRKKI